MSTTVQPTSTAHSVRPTVSVVVATFNRPTELDRLLLGLSVQESMPNEVIVVDDGSTQPSKPSFPEVDQGPTWTLIRQENAGPGSARDTGIRHAAGELIVVVDDDMVVTPRLVASHLEMHAAGADVVQGHFEDSDATGQPLFTRFIAEQQDALFERCANDPFAFEPVRLATGNVSFARERYLDVGGFDLSLRRREDSELGIRFAAAGAKLAFCAEPTAVHDEPVETLQQWMQLAFEYGESERTIADRHPDKYQPWELINDMPAPARVVISATKRYPRLMRATGRSSAAAARILERVGADTAAVKSYGLAFVLHWFAGMATAFNRPEASSLTSQASSPSGRTEASGRRAVDFGGVPVDVVSLGDAVGRIVDLGDSDAVSIVVTPNVDHLVLFRRNESFARTYRRANLILADGVPLVALSRLLRLPLREKVSGSDLIDPLVAGAAAHGSRIFLLGSTDETAAIAEAEMVRRNPSLQVVGRASPWFTPGSSDPATEHAGVAEALEAVRASRADIVLLAFGAPKQEELLDEFADSLPPACFVCCVASLDFVAGKVTRAPAWVSKWGLEWLYRLKQEPGRLWKRYIVRDSAALPIFIRMAWRRVRGQDLVIERSAPPVVEASR